jgi:Lrp/AsnC family transcriptional regulator for asnA, asnC and gidA
LRERVVIAFLSENLCRELSDYIPDLPNDCSRTAPKAGNPCTFIGRCTAIRHTTVTSNDAPPGPADIDETDRKILKILQTDGRVALSEIARRLDMGSATIHERTNDLEERGYIREYRAVLDPEMLGFPEVAFVQVETEAGRASGVAERLAENPSIQEIHEVTGDSDVLLKIRVPDRDALTDLLTRIGEHDGVRRTATNIALRSVREENRLDL